MTYETHAHCQFKPYHGEAIDPRSRSRVRKIIDSYMKDEWKTWWVSGVSNYNRAALVFECMHDLDQYWFGRNDAGNACYSANAVAEEIDYYLPKTFWKHKRKKRKASSQVMIDPEWKTFQGWHFEYEETIARLTAECQAMQERIERYRKR